MRLHAPRLLTVLLFLTALDSSECLKTTVQPNAGSIVTVSTELTLAQCAICTVTDANTTSCQSSLSLEPSKEVQLLFNCSQPIQESFTVTIVHSIECTVDSCELPTVEVQPSLLAEFPRTFQWRIGAPEKTVVTLNILGEGLRETSQPCSDGFQYSTALSDTDSKGRIQYCRGGAVTHLSLMDKAVVFLEVKPDTKVDAVLFQATAGPLKGPEMVVSVGPGAAVDLKNDQGGPECEVCTLGGSSPDCSTTGKTLSGATKHTLQFMCLRPQDVFSVTMMIKIECSQDSCTPPSADVQPNFFKEFKRTLTWDIGLPERTALTVNFPATGIKEIPEGETCQDGLQYTVSTTRSNGKMKMMNYCKGGTESELNLYGATTVTAEVAGGTGVDATVFSVTAAPRGGRMVPVTTDSEIIITINRQAEEPDCSACETSPKNCDPNYLYLKQSSNTAIEFTCPEPQQVFNVEINKEIDCTEITCPGEPVQAEKELFPKFNRTFTWDVKVDTSRTFQLDFPEEGMQQIPNEETCPDGHTYSVHMYPRSGPTKIGTFCKGGAVSTIQVRYKGRLMLQVPGHVKMEPVEVKVSVGPATPMLAIVKVDLPRGVSDTEILSPNYPKSFPDDKLMQWNFTMPGMHNYSVHFSDHTSPECLSNEVAVRYEKENQKMLELSLTDPQPRHQQGDFKMVLRNCQTNQTLQGLALKYKVSVMRSGHPVLCAVDLTNNEDVSMQIEKIGSDPYCEVRINSVIKEKVNVPAGTKASLSFLDCPKEDVRLTGSKVVKCQDMVSCPPTYINVPQFDSCLPMPLFNFTWHFSIPQHSTLDLVSPTGSLKQSMPGQPCSKSFSLHVTESDGFPVGDYCFGGTIKKLQIHTNVSVTARAEDFERAAKPVLSVNISEEISETFIYTVVPDIKSPTVLVTPNWPNGMKQFSTISWIVVLPDHYRAQLRFVNVSQPSCGKGHTSIKVKLLGSEEELMSRTEEEKMETELSPPHSFYLNVDNCQPDGGQLSAMTEITLQKKTNLLAILLGLAGALLILLIVLLVVCVVTKKKKKKLKRESTYMPKGNIFRPNDQHFTKTRSDNDSHVYDYIDDSMVYGHLLTESTYPDSIAGDKAPTDTYQTFMGPTDGALPAIIEPEAEPEVDRYKTFLDPAETFIPSRPHTPINRQDSLGYHDRRMVDNELYTFKNTGDINTIRLSAGEQGL